MTLDTSLDSNTPTQSVSALSRQRIATLYPGLRPLAFRVLRDMELATSRPVNVTEALRNMDHQLDLYRQGRELLHGRWVITDSSKIVTNAKPGLSYHNYGLAWDVAFAGSDPYLSKLKPSEQDSLWSTYGAVVKKWNLKWGGDFRLANGVRDLPHAELSYGLCISECVELYERGGLMGVWAYLDQLRNVPVGTDWGLA